VTGTFFARSPAAQPPEGDLDLARGGKNRPPGALGMEAAKAPETTQMSMTVATETFLPTGVTEPTQIVLPFGLIGLSELRDFDL
jgi:hypothetical protein